SPVWAPDGLAWQSCPPTPTGLPRQMSTTRATSVAGGHNTISGAPAPRPRAASTIAVASAVPAAHRPFIFQLPAINCRRWDISDFPREGREAYAFIADGLPISKPNGPVAGHGARPL